MGRLSGVGRSLQRSDHRDAKSDRETRARRTNASFWDVGWSVETPLPAGIGLPPGRTNESGRASSSVAYQPSRRRFPSDQLSADPATAMKLEAEMENEKDVEWRRHRFSKALEAAIRVQEETGYLEGSGFLGVDVNNLLDRELQLEGSYSGDATAPPQRSLRVSLTDPDTDADDWEKAGDDEEGEDATTSDWGAVIAAKRKANLWMHRAVGLGNVDSATGASLASYALGNKPMPAAAQERSARRPMSWEDNIAPDDEKHKFLQKRVRRLSAFAYNGVKTVVRRPSGMASKSPRPSPLAAPSAPAHHLPSPQTKTWALLLSLFRLRSAKEAHADEELAELSSLPGNRARLHLLSDGSTPDSVPRPIRV